MSETRCCVVCGANVVKSRLHRREPLNPQSDTCDPICTRAKNAGRTREQQYWFEDESEMQER